jgi:hypothetical protein
MDFSCKKYADHGTGGSLNLSVWGPNSFELAKDEYAVGFQARPDYNSGKGIVVKDVSSDKTALKSPVGWEFIWNDQNSGGDNDGSCWRPIAPDGYVTLGDIFCF